MPKKETPSGKIKNDAEMKKKGHTFAKQQQ